MNLTQFSDQASVDLVEGRFIPAMNRLADRLGMGFAQTPTSPKKLISSRVSHANICFRKPSWGHCHIYFEFLKRDWCDLQYGCGYWTGGNVGRIAAIDNEFSRIKMSNIMGWQKNDGGSWICKRMDKYRTFDEVFFRALTENEDEVVGVFEEKILAVLDVVRGFEHIL